MLMRMFRVMLKCPIKLFVPVAATVLLFLPSVSAVVPSYMPAPGQHGFSRLDLITYYFKEGFRYSEIILLLFVRHGIKLSTSHFKRILKSNNLYRRFRNGTPLHQVAESILQEIHFSGYCLGYRSMWRRLVRDHRMRVKRNDVMKLLQILDADGVEIRKANTLTRRLYYANGPNYVWHIDGYDKLKPFGFCIHGCIDGYSRRILWLEVSSTNNNPRLIAKYYLDTLKQTKMAPRLLRCDLGTENSIVEFLQPMFRFNANDSMSGLKSFMYGKSTSNQRIESWWAILRRQGIHWWINCFKDLIDTGLFDTSDSFHTECLKFCCMDVIQAELDRIAQHWNLHEIRAQKGYSELPHGKPDVMYFIPELFGGQQYGTKVDTRDIVICEELYSAQKRTCCPEFIELASLLKPNLVAPNDAAEALSLYIELTELYASFSN